MAGKPNFPGRLGDERIHVFQRRHWYTLTQWMTVPGLAWMASLLVAFLIGEASLASILPFTDQGIALAWAVLLLPTTAWILWTYLDWRNDLYIVTDQRAIRIQKTHFLFERRDETYLDRIQDVLVMFSSPAANLLGFGSVEIQTAGSTGKIAFEGIARPHAVQKAVFQLIERDRRSRRETERAEEELEPIRDLLGLPSTAPLQPDGEPASVTGEPYRQRFVEVVRRAFRPAQIHEEEYHIWRKHWWILVEHLVGPALLLALLVVGWISLHVLMERNFPPLLDLILAPLLGAILVWIAWQVLDWQNDMYIVTPDRVIDIEKVPIVFEHRLEANLGRIQSVRYTQPSFAAKQMDFGNVLLETAGVTGMLTFDNVPHPEQVQETIVEYLEAFRERTQRKRRQSQDENILKWLSRYHRSVNPEDPTP
jgi:uncharacterized membrane protein YdbT with pleckstrin-like domain